MVSSLCGLGEHRGTITDPMITSLNLNEVVAFSVRHEKSHDIYVT